MHPQPPVSPHRCPPTSTDTSATGTLASSTVCRAILSVTDDRGPRLFAILEAVLYLVHVGCFTGLVWLQMASDMSTEDTSMSVALHAVCCVAIAALWVDELAQIRVFRMVEFKGVQQKILRLDNGFSDGAAPLSQAYHYGAGRFLAFVVLLAGILVRARTAQSTPRVQSSFS